MEVTLNSVATWYTCAGCSYHEAASRAIVMAFVAGCIGLSCIAIINAVWTVLEQRKRKARYRRKPLAFKRP
jgi:hypothetical protein